MNQASWAALLIIIAAGPAQADGLDGIWCSPDGRRITVDGLAVVSPGGQPATGVYGTVDFSFPVPEGEPDAGAVIWMKLVDENTARVSTVSEQQGEPPPHGRWRRCAYTSSLTPDTVIVRNGSASAPI